MYMMYGMTYEQFWYDKPILAWYFREAYKLKLKERNEDQWRQGLYFLDALNVALHNNINLSGKSSKPLKYMEEPLRIFPETEEEKEVKAEAQRDKVVESLERWRLSMRNKYGNRNSEP